MNFVTPNKIDKIIMARAFLRSYKDVMEKCGCPVCKKRLKSLEQKK
jgi:hypothetical protein